MGMARRSAYSGVRCWVTLAWEASDNWINKRYSNPLGVWAFQLGHRSMSCSACAVSATSLVAVASARGKGERRSAGTQEAICGGNPCSGVPMDGDILLQINEFFCCSWGLGDTYHFWIPPSRAIRWLHYCARVQAGRLQIG